MGKLLIISALIRGIPRDSGRRDAIQEDIFGIVTGASGRAGIPARPPRVPSLPQVRWLLRAALHLPVLDPAPALALVAYIQRHNLAA